MSNLPRPHWRAVACIWCVVPVVSITCVIVKAPSLLVILDEARTGSYNCGVLNSNVTVVLYHFPGTVNIPRQNLMNYESTSSFSFFSCLMVWYMVVQRDAVTLNTCNYSSCNISNWKSSVEVNQESLDDHERLVLSVLDLSSFLPDEWPCDWNLNCIFHFYTTWMLV